LKLDGRPSTDSTEPQPKPFHKQRGIQTRRRTNSAMKHTQQNKQCQRAQQKCNTPGRKTPVDLPSGADAWCSPAKTE
jgi:hypothetical protein